MIRVTIGRFYNESWIAYRVCLELLLLVFSYVWKHKFSLNLQTPLGSKKKNTEKQPPQYVWLDVTKVGLFDFQRGSLKYDYLLWLHASAPTCTSEIIMLTCNIYVWLLQQTCHETCILACDLNYVECWRK